jgi:hypothetical protein
MREGHDNVTVNVFLGKSRGIRKNAEPNTTELAILAPEKLEPLSKNATQNGLKQLKRFWSNNRIEENHSSTDQRCFSISKDS